MTEQEPCKPGCPICTDTTPADQWDAPWPAYRWTPDLEEQPARAELATAGEGR